MFIKEFFKNPVKTGAIKQSSKYLSKLITDQANLQTKNVIVEFGSGAGAFTREIMQKKQVDSVFFSIEQNETFARLTRNNVPGSVVYHDSAENVQHYLQLHGLKGCDCIISGLPWGAFNKQFQRDLLQTTYDALNPGGEFLTFAYHHGSLLPNAVSFRSLLLDVFNNASRSEIIWRNVPPAFVYHCVKQ